VSARARSKGGEGGVTALGGAGSLGDGLAWRDAWDNGAGGRKKFRAAGRVAAPGAGWAGRGDATNGPGKKPVGPRRRGDGVAGTMPVPAGPAAR
jgi:hypothetical protein